MKTCNTCGDVKPFAEFHRCKSKADGLSGRCKSCQSEYYREWRKNNASRAEYERKYRAENAEHLTAVHAKWQRENPEKCRTYTATHRAKKRAATV
ncbi:hypothetical protein AB0P37_08460 [Streptomyces antimycoticus]|uniref:hypothetical protein n=1 Tax=Streptomyces antimycoticus TaxID=68175 RepID=UPI003431E7F0